jgi:hypothetical protein
MKMIQFRSYLVETLSKYLAEIINHDKGFIIFSSIWKYFQELKLQLGMKIHPCYLSYVVNRVVNPYNLFEYTRINSKKFYLILDLFLTSSQAETNDPRI